MKIGGFLLVITTLASAAPQFQLNNEQVMPYEFAYGVSDESTGDVKEHKESVSPSGRTEGEYRWLQPNGLYRITRYSVDGDAGYQATVSEEPGEQVSNYYFSTLGNVGSNSPQISQQVFGGSQSSGNGAAFSGSVFSRNQQAFGAQGDSTSRLSQQQTFTSSQDSRIRPSFGSSQSTRIQPSFGSSQSTRIQPSFGSSQSTRIQPSFGSSQSSRIQPAFGNLQFSSNQQTLGSAQSTRNRGQSFSTAQGFQNQQNTQITGSVVDGGIIDGGIIDGGIINGGFVEGGNAFSNINSFSQVTTRPQASFSDNSGINRGVAVILAGDSLSNSFRG
ncbi:nuclear pore complex protein NUP98B-like [Penaeus japonicus]|uniref:nuclear pore complex protein NUP98B-like n=1 Tax=Penaeus japonicus TaxID=27405 RepID=UPI001C70EB38|nr:nuclear pore complex protein NUP98B-like [Penaeus japonicus]